MQWQVSIWNYHKLALLTSLWVFILLTPPIYGFISKSVKNQMWVAFVMALLVWSFVFIILHTYSGKNQFTNGDDELR